jgi:uncharacterized membrane protein
MNIYSVIILRTIHIFSSVLWVGSAISYLFFVEPTVKSLGPGAPKFMKNFIEKHRYSQYMSIVSFLTILTGVLLFWNSSGGLQISWIKTGPGVGFTIGSLASLLVFLLGMLMIRPRAERMGALGKEIEESGNPPNPSQMTEMQKLDKELSTLGRADVILLVIALLTMVTARYWGLLT